MADRECLKRTYTRMSDNEVPTNPKTLMDHYKCRSKNTRVNGKTQLEESSFVLQRSSTHKVERLHVEQDRAAHVGGAHLPNKQDRSAHVGGAHSPNEQDRAAHVGGAHSPNEQDRAAHVGGAHSPDEQDRAAHVGGAHSPNEQDRAAHVGRAHSPDEHMTVHRRKLSGYQLEPNHCATLSPNLNFDLTLVKRETETPTVSIPNDNIKLTAVDMKSEVGSVNVEMSDGPPQEDRTRRWNTHTWCHGYPGQMEDFNLCSTYKHTRGEQTASRPAINLGIASDNDDLHQGQTGNGGSEEHFKPTSAGSGFPVATCPTNHVEDRTLLTTGNSQRTFLYPPDTQTALFGCHTSVKTEPHIRQQSKLVLKNKTYQSNFDSHCCHEQTSQMSDIEYAEKISVKTEAVLKDYSSGFYSTEFTGLACSKSMENETDKKITVSQIKPYHAVSCISAAQVDTAASSTTGSKPIQLGQSSKLLVGKTEPTVNFASKLKLVQKKDILNSNPCLKEMCMNEQRGVFTFIPSTMPLSVADAYIAIEKRQCEELGETTPPSVVWYAYNPLEYAFDTHYNFIQKYCNSLKKILFLGMNPGPWGMAQNGVPFGEAHVVRDWLKISGTVLKPVPEHPKRLISGLECTRSEISGRRFWGLFQSVCDTPEDFFTNCFVYNMCPLSFMSHTGKNITPPQLGANFLNQMNTICDKTLLKVIILLNISTVVGVGKFPFNRAKTVLSKAGVTGVRVENIMHPSPLNRAASKGWSGLVEQQLQDLNLLGVITNKEN